MRRLRAMTAFTIFAIMSSQAYAESRDVTLETPFMPLPDMTSAVNDKSGLSSPLQQKQNPNYTHERYARRLKDEQNLEKKGLSPVIARKAVWSIAHRPQSSCAIYAMHLAGYHEMKFVRPDMTSKSDKETDDKLVALMTEKKLCEKSRLNLRLPPAAPYVKANSVASLFRSQPRQARSILIAAGVSPGNADDAAWIVINHPESSCAWQVERILADERRGDRHSDDEKDAVLKIEHRNECSRAYYR